MNFIPEWWCLQWWSPTVATGFGGSSTTGRERRTSSLLFTMSFSNLSSRSLMRLVVDRQPVCKNNTDKSIYCTYFFKLIFTVLFQVKSYLDLGLSWWTNKRPKGPLSLTWVQWTCQKFDFGMEPKTTTLLPTCFKIIAMHSVCCCSLPVRRLSFFKKGTPTTYFCPALDPPLGRYGQNTLMRMNGHEYFIPTKFRKHPLSSTVEKADYVFPYIYMH